MAETLGEFYARIGLNFDDLENGIVEAQRTLSQNLARLNRERNIINIQTRIDLEGLNEATDATRIFEVRQRSLQRQLQNQRTRLNLLNDALQDTIQRTGENSNETQNASIAYENARLAVARLTNQLEELNETQNSGESWTDRLVSFSQKLSPVISVSRAFFDVANLANEATEKLIEKFRELQKTAYDFNLPIEKADEFARRIRLAGGELEDVGGYLRGITDALIKGEIDDPEFIALKRYGETIFDAKGKLKSYAEIWEAIHRAFKKAKAEGNEINFLQMTGGESGVTDAMKALQNWEKAVEDADKVIKAKIDYSQLTDATRQTNLLSEQMDEFGKQVAEIFSPLKIAMAKNFFAVIRAGTDFLARNRDNLKDSFELPNAFTSPVKYQKAEENYLKRLTAEIKNEANNLNKVFEASAGLEQEHAALKERLGKQGEALTQYSHQRAMDLKDAIEDLRLEIDFDSDYEKALAQARLEQERALKFFAISEEERKKIQEKYLADIEKAEKDHKDKLEDLWRETAAIQYETTHSAFEKQIYDIRQWKKKAIEDLGELDDAIDKSGWIEEHNAIIANAAAKERQVIETERERILDITKETANIEYEMTHSAFEKELRDIEIWKQAQTEKASTFNEVAAVAANAAIKETQAFEQEIDRIRGKTQSLAEKIFEQEHSRKEIDIMKAQKERAQMIEEGIYPQEWIDRWYENELAKISADAKKNRDYRSAPKLDYSQKFIPDVDFYGNLQADVEKYAPKLNIPTIDIGNIDTLTDSAGKAAIALAQIPQATQTFIGTMQENAPPLGIMKNSGAQQAMAQLSPPSIDRQDISAKIKDAAQKLTQGKDAFALSQNLAIDLTPITQELVTLTQTVGGIAQDIQNFQKQKAAPPNVTVNLTVHNDLGGAYVFDDAMKVQLTDDIGTNVVNSITDAVTKAQMQGKFNFG